MKAYEYIERGWTQGTFARGADGQQVLIHEARATCFCVLGAIIRAYPDPDGQERVFGKLCVHLGLAVGQDSLSDWNDHPDRTRDEVLEALKAVDI